MCAAVYFEFGVHISVFLGRGINCGFDWDVIEFVTPCEKSYHVIRSSMFIKCTGTRHTYNCIT